MRSDWFRGETLSLIAALALVLACGGGGGTGQPDVEPTTGEPSSDEPAAAELGLGEKLEALLAGVDPPRSYEMRSVPPAGQPAMTMIVKMAGREPVKAKVIQEDGWMLMDLESGETYAYEPREDLVMKLPTGGADQKPSNSPSDYVDFDATTVGVETVDGVRCWVIESRVGQLESRVWVGAGDGLPRQFETDKGLTRFVYSRIDQIADSELELPPGIEVMDMAKMMQQGFRQRD